MSTERMPDPESRIRLLRSAPIEGEPLSRPSPPGSRAPNAPAVAADAIQRLLQRASHETAATLRRRFAEERGYLNPGLSDRTLRKEFIDPLLTEISEVLLALAPDPDAHRGSWR